MMLLLKNIRGISESKSIDNYPDVCPICHKGMEPFYIDATMKNYEELQIVFLCPIKSCCSYFIGKYFKSGYRDISGVDFYLSRLTPYYPESVTFSEIISDISSNFCEIYKQAMSAEQYGLTEVCGPGYRKALEFLVKDYLVRQNPDKEQAIKSMFLGACIKDYIDDTRIRECAERAVWLGNDETHYIRKWIDKDLQDLKILIRLTVNFVESDLLASKYKFEMDVDRVNSKKSV